MANRDNHYEAAFEAFLRDARIPYVAVDESRRALMSGGSLKSLDFIVSPPGEATWLVDVKGRRFPSGDEQKQYWKNWSTRDDLLSLSQWERLFGPRFEGLLVFAYHLVGDRSPLPADQPLRLARPDLRLRRRSTARLRASRSADQRELGHGGDADGRLPRHRPSG